MIAEICEALEAGASEEKSKVAAVALADAKRFDRLETDMTEVKVDSNTIRSDVAVVKAELAMMKWIVSGVGFGAFLLVLKSFWPS